MQNKGKRISVACFPKSGSTFITKSLSAYTGFPILNIKASPEVQELSEYYMEKINGTHSYIAQSHILPTKYNLKLLEKYGLTTVFIYRNVLDCLVSLRDMYVERIEFGKGVWSGSFISQWGIFHDHFLNLDLSEQLDYMIDVALPWYLLCYAAWDKKINSQDYTAVFLSYETFFSDTEKQFHKLVQDLGVYQPDKSKLFTLPNKTSGPAGVRFNVGRIGRGREILTHDQQNRIHQIAKRIASSTKANFSPIIDQ